MARLKTKGDLAEIMVAADILRRGHKIAFPFGENWRYDLIVCRHGTLERVQVKHARSDGHVIPVRCRTLSLTNGKVREITKYTAQMIDWIAVYDATSDRCYFVPASELGAGSSLLHLRLTPARNGMREGVRAAADYLAF